jgi:methyl-accepting chemotaxis protein
VFGKKVGSSVAEYVVDKIIPGYKQDLSVISKVSDVLAESAENLKKKSVELKKAFPHPDFKEAARILPEMFRDFKQFAGVNIMLGQIQTMLNKVRNSLKDNAEAVQAIDETIKAIDKTKEGLSYVWDLPNGIANSLREIAQQIELMFTVETRSRSSSVSLQPAG